jgi:hypothetical protein
MAATKTRAGLDQHHEETTCAPLKHPLRVRILEVCNERDISPITFVNEGLEPSGITFKDRQHALSHVSYHFRELEKADCIEVVETNQRRGATEHIYRGTATVFFTDEEFAAMPKAERRSLSRTSFQGLIARVDGAMRADTFDSKTDRHLTWLPMELDERGWDEVMGAMADCYHTVKQMSEDAQDRLAGSGGRIIPATYGMVGFESPELPVLVDRLEDE